MNIAVCSLLIVEDSDSGADVRYLFSSRSLHRSLIGNSYAQTCIPVQETLYCRSAGEDHAVMDVVTYQAFLHDDAWVESA